MHDATGTPVVRVDVDARGAFELLVGLWIFGTPSREPAGWLAAARPSDALARDLQALGEQAGELWLHLLGVALESESRSAAELVHALTALDAHELRRHLVGVHVPAWRTVAGAETLEAAAAGDARACRALLDDERYYAGRARAALGRVLPLGAEETKERLVAAARRFATELFGPHEEAVTAALEADAAAKLAFGSGADALSLVAAATGFDYEPEPEASRVLLLPHAAGRPWLLLCQHRDTRILCYPAGPPAEREAEVREAGLRLGRALADPTRVDMIRQLAAGDATLNELAAGAGLSRSTAHHHLGLLRAAGLVSMRGNARSYSYALRPQALREAEAALAALVSPRLERP